MGDENSSLVPVSVAQKFAKLVTENPESIFIQIKEAEDWITEMKELARQQFIKRMAEGSISTDYEADAGTINCKKNSGNIKPDVIYATFVTLKLDPFLVVHKKPVEYQAFPNARITLEAMLKEKVITQAQYDSFFDKSKYVVSVKPKSAKTLVNGEG